MDFIIWLMNGAVQSSKWKTKQRTKRNKEETQTPIAGNGCSKNATRAENFPHATTFQRNSM